MILRPVASSDYEGVAACLRRNGMAVRSEPDWRRLWDEHPYAAEFEDVPRGLVLEADGRIVGTISILWAKYWLRGRSLRVAISGNAAVDLEHRGGSIRLMGEAVRQPGVDLYINGSPSDVAAKLMDSMKVRRVPQPNYDVSLLWTPSGRRLARAGLVRRGLPFSGALSWPLGLAFALLSSWKMRRAPRGDGHVQQESAFSSEFEDLWDVLRDETDRLIAFRDEAMLRWRYEELIHRGDARLLTARLSGRLAGYAILKRVIRPALGIEQYTIHDIQCVRDNAEVSGALLRAALHWARRDGMDLLEWVGHSGTKRTVAEGCAALRYQMDVWQAYYHTRDPELKTILAASERWSFGPYDSD